MRLRNRAHYWKEGEHGSEHPQGELQDGLYAEAVHHRRKAEALEEPVTEAEYTEHGTDARWVEPEPTQPDRRSAEEGEEGREHDVDEAQ